MVEYEPAEAGSDTEIDDAAYHYDIDNNGRIVLNYDSNPSYYDNHYGADNGLLNILQDEIVIYEINSDEEDYLIEDLQEGIVEEENDDNNNYEDNNIYNDDDVVDIEISDWNPDSCHFPNYGDILFYPNMVLMRSRNLLRAVEQPPDN